MKNIFKILFISFLVIALAFIIYYITLYNNWPFMQGVYIFSTIILFIITLLIIRYFYNRYKEKEYIKNIISQDSSKVGSIELNAIKKSVEKSWYSSLSKLTNSLLKTHSEPIYTLPWFIIMGAKSSGKTELLDNISMKSFIKEDLNHKENCSWWYFDSAVILNITSRYLNKNYDLTIAKEWEYLIGLMKETRSKEPINGIIITISIEDLISKDNDLLLRESLVIKKRIDEIISSFGAKLPIYIVITKMDKIFGYIETQNYILNKDEKAILGHTNNQYNDESNTKNNIASSISYIVEKLKDISLDVFIKRAEGFYKINYFVKEFDTISNKINDYINSIFEDSLYQHIPKYRGIYLTSSLNKDTKLIHIDKNLDNLDILTTNEEIVNKKPINNFFREILPFDRNIFSFLKLEKQFYIQIISSIIISIFVTTWFTVSYIQNDKILDMVSKYNKSLTVKNNFDANTHIMYQKLLKLKHIKELYEDSIFAKYGFTQSRELINKLETSFNIEFVRSILLEFDKYVEEITYSEVLNDNEYSTLVAYLLENIQVYKDLLNKKSFKINDISYVNYVVNLRKIIKSNLVNKEFIELYYYFLNSTTNRQLLKDRFTLMEQYLKVLLSNRKVNLNWLISKAIIRHKDIFIYDFWPDLDNNSKLDSIYINAAFTSKGKDEIVKYIELLQQIVPKGEYNLNYSIAQFWSWYDDMFFYSWDIFIRNFNTGFKYYDYSVSRPMLLLSMFSKNNPYKLLINKFSDQLTIYKDKDIPKWAEEIKYLQEIITISSTIDMTSKDQSFIKDIRMKHEETRKEYGANKDEKYSNLFDNAILLNEYFKSFKKLEFINNNLHDEINKFFSSNRSQSNLNKVYENLLKLKYSLKKDFGEYSYNIVKGPFDFILNYTINREACILNEKWNNDVILPSKNINKISMINKLFNDNGLVKSFLEDSLVNYITSYDGLVYTSRKIDNNYYIPFKKDFIAFLTKGMSSVYTPKNEYKIKVITKPMKINKTSKIFPYKSDLKINCDDNIFKLSNYNYKAEKEFIWTPKSCKSVEVSVLFDNIQLKKTYTGKDSFFLFLKDIGNNNLRLTTKNSVTNKSLMLDKGLQWVDLYYKLSNVKDILRINKQKNIKIPKLISQCKSNNEI